MRNPTIGHWPDCTCPLCRLAAGDERYRQLWGLATATNDVAVPRTAKPKVSITELAAQRRH